MPLNNTILVAGVLPGGAGATWSLPSAGFSNPMYVTSPTLGSSDATGFDITGMGTVSISFEGSYTGATVLHQQTNDPAGVSGWFNVDGIGSDASTASTTGSAAGVCYTFPALGMRHRIQVTAISTGTLACRIVGSQETNGSPTVISGSAVLAVTLAVPGTPITGASGNVANASAVATLAGVAGKTTYITGFEVTAAGATAAAVATVVVANTVTGSLTYIFVFPAGATTTATPLVVEFPMPIPANAVNTAITVTLGAGGAGNTNAAVVAHGFQA